MDTDSTRHAGPIGVRLVAAAASAVIMLPAMLMGSIQTSAAAPNLSPAPGQVNVTPAPPGPAIIYDSTASPLPPTFVSLNFEATSLVEFGNKITLAPTAQALEEVTVTLVSLACQSGHWNTNDCVSAPAATFSQPVTFNIYAPGAANAVGALIVTDTATFEVPYRPSADNVNCTGANSGKWFDPTTGACSNGMASNVTFDFAPQHVVLPGTVIFGISYNTTDFGPHPIGSGAACVTSSGGCPYDNLNVGLTEDPTDVSVGSDPLPGTIYMNSLAGGAYCDGGAAGTGTFRLDSPGVPSCWGANPLGGSTAPFLVPSVQFTAAVPGYWLAASDGGVFTFGAAAPFHGSMGGTPLNAPVVGMSSTPSGGYWLAASDGGVFAFGAPFLGSMGGHRLNSPIVGIAATPDGDGYYLVASDGGVFTFGDAVFHGSMGGKPLNKPIVGVAVTPGDNGGYYLVASDGGVFTFGDDAVFQGSMGGKALNKPVVGIAVDPATSGYWLVASDGGVFAFGAPFLGSTGATHLNAPVVGMAGTDTGLGYRLVASDGGVFCFGTAPFAGSMGGTHLNKPIVGMSSTGA
jgi:hypothetical protein